MAADPSELVADLVVRGVVDAAQLAYRRDGEVVHATYGACDETSRFALASLTKPLVAMACLVACDEGVLDLDVPVTTYVPESCCSATLRELLSHASGLPADSPVARRTQLTADESWEAVAAAYAALAPAAAPRSERIYSNAGYALAALALERAADMSHGAYLDAAVLAPLGMTSTSLGAAVDDPTLIHVREPGLLGHGEQLFNGARFRTLGLPQSGGFGTAADYLQLLTCVAGQGQELLAEDTRMELITNQCGALAGGVGDFMEWQVCDWAVGFELRDGKAPHWTGDALSSASATHFGASGTLAFIDPQHDVCAVVLANRGTYSRWMLEPGGWPDICAALVA
jgi:CubicO group peptidase (beta-lactamase class C family)